jgi:hypothetical protein
VTDGGRAVGRGRLLVRSIWWEGEGAEGGAGGKEGRGG